MDTDVPDVSTNLPSPEGTNTAWVGNTTNQAEETGSSDFEVEKHQIGTNLLFNEIIDLPQTRRVYLSYDTELGVIEYWIIFGEEDRDARKKIYGIEYDLMEYFDDMELITHVVVADGVSDINLADSAKLVHDKDI